MSNKDRTGNDGLYLAQMELEKVTSQLNASEIRKLIEKIKRQIKNKKSNSNNLLQN